MTLPTFDKTVTLFHRIQGTAEEGYTDSWIIVKLNKCSISKAVITRSGVTIKNVDTTTHLKIKTLDIDGYIDELAYKGQQGRYTVSIDDFIFIGDIKEKNVTPKNVIEIVSKYKPNSIRVIEVKQNLTSGILPHIAIKGV